MQFLGIDLNMLKNGLKIYFTYDEEITFGGINELVKNKEKFPEFMIFGEPTNNEIYTGHKGLMEYKIYFKGKKAHSSLPDKGISANMNAVKFIYELDSFYTSEIKTDLEKAFDIPYTTMNVGLINGGTAINSISAFCSITLDFRIIKKEHIDIINNKVIELAEKYKADIENLDLIEPFLDNLGDIVETRTANYMTEASMVKDSKRIILGPGPVTAHEVNEHITEESYKKLINQYKELIYKICK